MTSRSHRFTNFVNSINKRALTTVKYILVISIIIFILISTACVDVSRGSLKGRRPVTPLLNDCIIWTMNLTYLRFVEYPLTSLVYVEELIEQIKTSWFLFEEPRYVLIKTNR